MKWKDDPDVSPTTNINNQNYQVLKNTVQMVISYTKMLLTFLDSKTSWYQLKWSGCTIPNKLTKTDVIQELLAFSEVASFF